MLRVHLSWSVCVRESVGVRATACVRVSVCVCVSTAGDPCGARNSDHACASGFGRSESLSFGGSDCEEEGSWDAEVRADGGSEKSAVGLVLVREDLAEVDAEEDVDRTGDGEEVEDGLRAAKEERKGVTAEGDEEEEDLRMGDLGAEEEKLALEDFVLLSQ